MLSASVTVDKQLISSIGKGILVFAAVAPGDTVKDADALAAKVLKMRLWDDESGSRVSACLTVCKKKASSDFASGNTMSKILAVKFYVVGHEQSASECRC